MEPNTEENLKETGETAKENTDFMDEGQGAAGSEGETPDQKLAEMNDKYIRLYSDFDNFRKRTQKEKADIISTASADVLKDLLVVLDDFERAIQNNDKVEDPKALKEGFKLIHHKLMLTLQAKGLEPTEAKGEVFDADKHEAITNVPVTEESQKGKVVDVVERGYNLKGKTLRFAKVIVGQ